MDENQAKRLYSMLQQYLIFYKDFLDFETQKLDDVANNRVKLLDEHVKNEEAFLLKSRGFEIKREEFVKELGLEGKTMLEVIETSPDNINEKLKSIFEDLSDTILDLKETNTRCNSMIELRLHSIQKTISKIEEGKNRVAQKENKGQKTEFISRKV